MHITPQIHKSPCRIQVSRPSGRPRNGPHIIPQTHGAPRRPINLRHKIASHPLLIFLFDYTQQHRFTKHNENHGSRPSGRLRDGPHQIPRRPGSTRRPKKGVEGVPKIALGRLLGRLGCLLGRAGCLWGYLRCLLDRLRAVLGRPVPPQKNKAWEGFQTSHWNASWPVLGAS